MSLNGERPGTQHKHFTRQLLLVLSFNFFFLVSVNIGREKPCVFCSGIRELLLYTGHDTGRYAHSDMFARVAPMPPDKMPMGTVSVSAGNDDERCTLLY